MSRVLCLAGWREQCPYTSYVCSLLLKALEDELNQKKREQEMFFKLSEEADGQMPASPTKHAKFVLFSSAESL